MSKFVHILCFLAVVDLCLAQKTSTVSAADPIAAGPVVIIHGAWGGSHHWKAFAEELRSKTSLNVYRVSLSGLGPRRHLLSREIKLQTHINDAVNLIEFDELKNVVLIGHSYGGLVAQGVVNEAPNRIAQVVYMDSHLLNSGESYLVGHPEKAKRYRELANEQGEGWFLPVTWDNSVRDTPHPFVTLTEPIELNDDFASGVQSHYWLFADGRPAEKDDRYRYVLRARKLGYQTQSFSWGHNPQRERPKELVAAFIESVLSTEK